MVSLKISLRPLLSISCTSVTKQEFEGRFDFSGVNQTEGFPPSLVGAVCDEEFGIVSS